MESIAHRPFSHAVSVSGCIPKWTHGVLQEPSFVSEWQANDAAFHLAWEVGTLPPQTSSGSTICPATHIAKAIMPHPVLRREGSKVDSVSQCPRGDRPSVKTVAFSEVLCIRIGEDTSNAFQDFVTHANALLSPWKPWKLLPSTDADQPFAQVHFEHDSPMCHPLQSKHPSTRFVQVNSMPLRASVQTEVLYAAPQEAEHPFTSFTVQPETNFDVSPRIPQVAQLGCSASQCSELCTAISNPEADAPVHSEKVTPCPVEHTPPSTGGLPTGKAYASRAVSPACSRSESCSDVSLVKHHREFLSGLSQIDALLQDGAQQPSFLHRAVTSSNKHALDQVSPSDHPGSLSLIHEKTHTAEVDKHINSGSCLPPLMQARREHESPIAHLVGPQSDDEDTNDEPMDTNNQPILPAFVNYLTNRLEALGLDPHDNDFDLPIRTWYIDHRTVHRWTAPRILQLVGPPRGWEAQIQSLWVDQLNNQDWFDGIIVEPDPPRIARHAFVVFDMIVTQSLEVPRFASMITVMPGTAQTFQMYTVACSLPEVVSGYELVQAADAGRYCRHAECLITYRWIQIPNTLRPTHHVGHGDGFQIVVHDQPHGSQTHRAEDASSSDAITTSPTYSPGRPGQAASSTQPARFTTTLHLFQLEGVEICCQIMNDQRIMPTQEIADALHITLDQLDAVHVMPHMPYQIPEYDMAAVVQRAGDLAHNTMDRLLLVDIIYHHHPNAEGVTHRPTLVREVQRVGHQLLRQHILLAAAVHHYCVLISNQCVVTLDGSQWPEDDHLPRPVQHGSYAQVIVPPPPTHQIQTQEAVAVVQDTMDNPEDITALIAPSSTDEDAAMPEETNDTDTDALQLTQLAVQHRSHGYKLSPMPKDADRPPLCLGAVLQHFADLNPQTSTVAHTCTDEPQQSNRCIGNTLPTQPSPSANSHTEDRDQGIQPKPTLPTDHMSSLQEVGSSHTNTIDSTLDNHASTVPAKQTKISSFFAKVSSRLHTLPNPKQTKQTKISQFFPAISPKEPPAQPTDLLQAKLLEPVAHEPVTAESVMIEPGMGTGVQPTQARTWHVS